MTAKTWQVQEAKQRFSELVERAINEGPQVVTRHGKKVVVVTKFEEDDEAEAFKRWILDGPVVDDEFVDIMDQIAADRKRSMPLDLDLDL